MKRKGGREREGEKKRGKEIEKEKFKNNDVSLCCRICNLIRTLRELEKS
jgi:hypothetical protein